MSSGPRKRLLHMGRGHPHTRGREYGAGTPGECKDMGEDRPGMSFLMVPGLPSHTVRRND